MGLTYIASVTASASASLAFTTGIDATYNEYQFHFVNIHPATDAVEFQFQVNASDDTGGGFDTSLITSTYLNVYHYENDSSSALNYETGHDEAQAANYQDVSRGVGNGDDESVSGVLTLYAPSSTTYVKHFTARTNDYSSNGPLTYDFHAAGYINVTAAIDEISFKFHTGNIDDGTIKMFGVS
jgi:hypothetical protein